jgi:hypothetical protein
MDICQPEYGSVNIVTGAIKLGNRLAKRALAWNELSLRKNK